MLSEFSKNQKPSKVCASHRSQSEETRAEKVSVPPEFDTAKGEAAPFTEDVCLAQQGATVRKKERKRFTFLPNIRRRACSHTVLRNNRKYDGNVYKYVPHTGVSFSSQNILKRCKRFQKTEIFRVR